jgi:hypothetical protein
VESSEGGPLEAAFRLAGPKFGLVNDQNKKFEFAGII